MGLRAPPPPQPREQFTSGPNSPSKSPKLPLSKPAKARSNLKSEFSGVCSVPCLCAGVEGFRTRRRSHAGWAVGWAG